MVNGNFIDLQKIAEESGCDIIVANEVALKVIESLHKSALVNGLSGSLFEAMMRLPTGTVYHLGGLYTAIGDSDTGVVVSETLLRMPPYDDWERFREVMNAWEQTLTEEQRYFVRSAHEKD